MDQALVLLEVKNGVAHIVLNNPPANKMNRLFFRQLGVIVNQLKQNGDVGAAVIYGKAKHFSSGADLKDISDMVVEACANGESQHPAAIEQVLKHQRILDELEGLDIPVVAAINGFCVGSGLELALACDFRICSSDAVMGFPEITWGLMTGCGGSIRAGRLIGAPKAKELILSGEFLNGQEALQIGLVNRVVHRSQVISASVLLAESLSKQAKQNTFLKKKVSEIKDREINL